MRKNAFAAALAGSLAGGLALSPAQAGPGSVKLKTEDGILFTFGITQELIPSLRSELDFDDRFNDNDSRDTRGVVSPSGIGETGDDDRTGVIGFESRLFFTAEKGRVSLYTAFELDGTLDERAIDNNNPNIERINVTLDLPEASSKLTVGADIYILDTVGRLVYLDDDPGFWVQGGRDNVTWALAYHKRQERSGSAGDSGIRFGGGGDGQDHDLISGRIGYRSQFANGTKWYLEPFAMFQSRAQPTRVNGVVNQNITQDQIAGFLGIGATLDTGLVKIDGEFAYHTGEVSNLRAPDGTLPFGRDEFDISAFGAHVRARLNMNRFGGWPLGGVAPFVSWDFASGDDDPDDGDLEGFVPVSTPNDLREDQAAFLRRSVVDVMPTSIGNQSFQFGFETNALGVGPTIGQIAENGVGGSAGYHRITAGVQGKINEKWGLFTRFAYLRYDDTSNLEALCNGAASAGNPSLAGSPVVPGTRCAQARAGVDTLDDIDEDIGWGYDINIMYWPQKNLQMGPFFSVFFPGDGAEDLIGNDSTALMGGVWMKGTF